MVYCYRFSTLIQIDLPLLLSKLFYHILKLFHTPSNTDFLFIYYEILSELVLVHKKSHKTVILSSAIDQYCYPDICAHSLSFIFQILECLIAPEQYIT